MSAVDDYEDIAAVAKRLAEAAKPKVIDVDSISAMHELCAKTDVSIGTQFRIRMPQPLMVYNTSTDEMVSLTQERLDQLIAIERAYYLARHDMRKILDQPIIMGGSAGS